MLLIMTFFNLGIFESLNHKIIKQYSLRISLLEHPSLCWLPYVEKLLSNSVRSLFEFYVISIYAIW